ncbi:uncharacterized protein METZ01_LOCUS455676 [marine metagenome]|uniref:Uncharacterized protein n=1 Tax=marine metagenome TaxID=408172 RepID=A0A383A4X8_9ZZZZ
MDRTFQVQKDIQTDELHQMEAIKS